MKETKVYVDELPESCKKCAYSQINLALGVETRICGLQYGFISIDIDKFPNCPLRSIKDHDRELVKEVCEKIRDLAESYCEISLCENCGEQPYNDIILTGNDLAEILDQIQKEAENEQKTNRNNKKL